MDQASVTNQRVPGWDQRDGTAERRSTPRFALVMKGLAEHAKLAGAGQLDVIASDIGAAGILLHTDAVAMVNEHDLLVLSFVPPNSADLVRLSVRVLWVKENVSKTMGRVSFGCAFVDTPPDRIARLIDPAREAAALRGIEEPY